MNNTEIAQKVVDRWINQDFLLKPNDYPDQSYIDQCYKEINIGLNLLPLISQKLIALQIFNDMAIKQRDALRSKHNSDKPNFYIQYFDLIIQYCANQYSHFSTKQLLRTVETNQIDILKRLYDLPGNNGYLNEILEQIDLPSTPDSVGEYLYKLTARSFIKLHSDTKDGTHVELTQQGKDFLRGAYVEKAKKVDVISFPKDPDAPTKQSDRANVHVSGIYLIVATLISLIIGFFVGTLTC